MSIPRVLIGGVGYRWQRDASFGLVVTDELMRLDWPREVEILDLGYGAIYASQDIAAAEPSFERLVLVAGKQRGREPGRLYTYTGAHDLPSEEEIQERIREAGAGLLDVDHLLTIGMHFGALPEEIFMIEMEPVDTTPGVALSEAGTGLIPRAIAIAMEVALKSKETVTR